MSKLMTVLTLFLSLSSVASADTRAFYQKIDEWNMKVSGTNCAINKIDFNSETKSKTSCLVEYEATSYTYPPRELKGQVWISLETANEYTLNGFVVQLNSNGEWTNFRPIHSAPKTTDSKSYLDERFQ